MLMQISSPRHVFEHYTGGCSALESFYQSVASPLQQLFWDPLARPYVPLVRVRLLGAIELSKELVPSCGVNSIEGCFVAAYFFVGRSSG